MKYELICLWIKELEFVLLYIFVFRQFCGVLVERPNPFFSVRKYADSNEQFVSQTLMSAAW